MITDFCLDNKSSVLKPEKKMIKVPSQSPEPIVFSLNSSWNDGNIGLRSNSFAYNVYHQTEKNWVVEVKGIDYLKSVIFKHPETVMDKEILSGMPTIKGTRIPVSLVISCLNDDMSIEEICEDYDLSEAQVKASLSYVEDLLNSPFFEE
ncbi:DUF433 domain-containing protein [Priestia sp. RMT2NF4]|uniref:DUF433 domain-containing protein n=1 Tax=Priestia sp. RMT2NF4 TaxID=3398394 RepID=UPI003A4C7D74